VGVVTWRHKALQPIAEKNHTFNANLHRSHSMSLSLKRKESLREGLQRISEKRLKGVLQVIGQEGLTANPVHKVRKTIKSLRATLRLTRGALSLETRKARNKALRRPAERDDAALGRGLGSNGAIMERVP
jgi:hypothetical protein